MMVKLELTFNSIEEMRAFLGGSTIAVGHAPTLSPVPQTLAQASNGLGAPAASQAPATTQPAAMNVPTIEELRAAMIGYIKKGEGRTAATAQAIMNEHGVRNVPECPPDKYPILIAAFQSR